MNKTGSKEYVHAFPVDYNIGTNNILDNHNNLMKITQ